MKIAYIAVKGIPFCGGIENYTDEVAYRLANMGHDVTVYSTSNYENKTGMTERGYRVIAIKCPRNKYFEKLTLCCLASLHQMIVPYDIVHYQAMGPSLLAFLAKLSGKAVVIQSHGIEYKRAKWGRFAKACLQAGESASLIFADSIVVVSKTLQKYFSEKYNRDTVYIPTGIAQTPAPDPEQPLPFGLEAKKYFLFMARLVPEKGVHYLIQAFRRIPVDYKLVIAGDGMRDDGYADSLKAMAEGDGRILFTGNVTGSAKEALLNNAYAFVQPSELEGLSIALLEAMSHKLCCIISNIPENLEATAGCSINFMNKNAQDLANKLLYSISDSHHVQITAQRAYNHVMQHHQWDDIANSFNVLYEQMITDRLHESMAVK
jgi:glycosyltransferase involved in cell wall biosynthesis